MRKSCWQDKCDIPRSRKLIRQTNFTLSYRGRSFRLFGPKVTNFCSIWSQRVGTFRPRSIAAIEASKLLLPAAAKPQKAFPDFSVFIFSIWAFLLIFRLFWRKTVWLSTESISHDCQNCTNVIKNWKFLNFTFFGSF